jgi:small subunit ribosomal protein S8
MSMTDPIADFLTRIRNALQAQHDVARVPSSGLKKEMARILQQEGYITGFEVEAPNADHPGEVLVIHLRYTDDRKSVITHLKRASRPGQRLYVPHDKIPKVLGGMGTAIVSTSHGVMTGHDARREGVGGEVIAFIQ